MHRMRRAASFRRGPALLNYLLVISSGSKIYVPFANSVQGVIFFHPSDEDLSLGARLKENAPRQLWLLGIAIAEPL